MPADDLDSLLLQWQDGEHQAVARAILAKPTPAAIRAVIAIRDEYEMIDGSAKASRVVDRLLDAIDAGHAALTVALTGFPGPSD